MNGHRWRVIAVVTVLGVALAGPSWAGGTVREYKGPSTGTTTQLATNPCPAGWKLQPGGTKNNFFCAPQPIKLKCPPDTKQVEKNCAVGCEPVIK